MYTIGLSTVCFIDRPVETAVDFILESGFRHMEVYSDIPHAWPGQFGTEKRAMLRRRAERAGVSLSVHVPAYHLNIASLNPGLRRESINQVLDAIDLAAEIGAANVVVHGGVVHFLHERMLEKTSADCLALAVSSLQYCAEHAGNVGVTICLENTCHPHAAPGSFREVATTVALIGNSSLKATFDIAHFYLSGESLDSLRQGANLIHEVHISDNNGLDDSHLPMGEGVLTLDPEVLGFLREFEGPIVLEIEDIDDPEGKAIASKKWLEDVLLRRA